jgi:DNA/RNA-binding domain of Phe-tRNA-synthetase-like protein
MKIEISEIIRQACPELALGIIECHTINTHTSEFLWNEMNHEISNIKANFTIEQINQRKEISETRKTYKKLGKDPNRYRPSAEALCRRIVRGIPIYSVNTLVDIINIVSVRSGFSIGAFDIEKIKGDLILDKGNSYDEFEAIGRGILNIEGLPVYRDETGGIGTPTSDCERTKISADTTRLLVIINAFGGVEGLDNCIEHCANLLYKYTEVSDLKIRIINE